MILNRVTFTGADDDIDPELLLDLSDSYADVEWGILFGSNFGAERFPSTSWLDDLWIATNQNTRPTQLSAHLCGAWVRDLNDGNASWLKRFERIRACFQRVQINYHGVAADIDHRGFEALYKIGKDHQLIIQGDGVNDEIRETLALQYGLGNVSILFDRSHGAGVLPGEWPKGLPGTYCGYAGGLDPDNTLAQLGEIAKQVALRAPVWIDMETGVRTEGRLDLHKVERVLRRVEPWIGELRGR